MHACFLDSNNTKSKYRFLYMLEFSFADFTVSDLLNYISSQFSSEVIIYILEIVENDILQDYRKYLRNHFVPFGCSH